VYWAASDVGRVDDVINVAGHRLSTGGMEEVISGHQCVAECAVIAAGDELKGQVPVGGKILRSTVRKIADGEDYKVPSTIDDPAILDEIAESLGEVGYGDR